MEKRKEESVKLTRRSKERTERIIGREKNSRRKLVMRNESR